MHAASGISGRHKMKAWKAAVGASGVLLTCASAPAFALGFDLFDGDVIGHFNTTASIGAAIRTESQSANLLGKGNLSRSEEHTSELQSLMRISYAVFCLKKKKKRKRIK